MGELVSRCQYSPVCPEGKLTFILDLDTLQYTMLYPLLTILFLTVSSVSSLPVQLQDEGEVPISSQDLQESTELGSDELASLLGDIQEVGRDGLTVVSMEEYDYNQVSDLNQDQILLVEETEVDTLYVYEDTIIEINVEKEPREKEDEEKVGEILPEKENKEIMSEYDYTDLNESDDVVEDDVKEEVSPGKENKEMVSEYDYNGEAESEYVVVFDLPSEYKDDAEYRKFVEAAKSKNTNKRSRMIVEFAMMSGMGLIGVTIMFGLISLANSCLRSRTSLAPQQVQITTTGGIIKQYTRVPVEINNLLPSNVAYKQLYES